MDNEAEIRKYFNKIQGAIDLHYSFRFLDYYFVEKRRIDDFLCCLLAIIPNSYKNKINIDIAMEQDGMCSIEAYKKFLEHFKSPFILSPLHYLVSKNAVKRDINTLLPLLLKDLEAMKPKAE